MHIMSNQVIRARRQRRDHSPEFKRELVARSLQPNASEQHGRQSPPAAPRMPGTIEIDLAGARVRLRGAVDEASVRSVLHTLHALA